MLTLKEIESGLQGSAFFINLPRKRSDNSSLNGQNTMQKKKAKRNVKKEKKKATDPGQGIKQLY